MEYVLCTLSKQLLSFWYGRVWHMYYYLVVSKEYWLCCIRLDRDPPKLKVTACDVASPSPDAKSIPVVTLDIIGTLSHSASKCSSSR